EFGKYKLNRGLFLERWLRGSENKGIVVFAHPNQEALENNVKDRGSKLTKKFFDYYIKGNLKAFFIILVISAILALSNLAFPILTKKIVDEAIPYSNYSLLATIVVAQIIIILAGNIFSFINEKLFIRITSKLNIEVLSVFLYKLSRIPFKFFELKNVSDIIQRVGDHTRIESFVTNNISSTIHSIISVFAFSILLLQYSTIIFVIFFVSLAISYLWTVSFTYKRNLIEYKRFSSYKSSMGSSFEIVQGMVDLKLNNAENYRIKEWENKQNKIYLTKEESLVIENKVTIGNTLISQIKNAFITFICAYLVINKSLTLGEMLSISYIIGALNAPLGTFLDFIKKWNETKFSFLRINEVNEMSEEDSKASKNINDLEEINVKEVSYRYSENSKNNILNDISINIKKGQKIAFVGKSGSGKTTMMKLLLKFYAPTMGNIFIDNIDLTEIRSKDWRELCGVVMQDGYIFTGSILDNIILDKSTVDYNRLEQVSKMANIKDHIDKLPKGYNTVLGQSGKGMSGGQIQRILIARALYQNPEILIFDEATSALDINRNNNPLSVNDYRIAYNDPNNLGDSSLSTPFENFVTERTVGTRDNFGHISFSLKNSDWFADELNAD